MPARRPHAPSQEVFSQDACASRSVAHKSKGRRAAGELVADKYEIVRLLGAGGMGEVYEARHRLIGRRFAIKFLHPECACYPGMLARFQREAETAGSLENQHVAAVVDFGSAADGSSYIVMEFLEGEDLAKLVARDSPLAVERAVGLVIQACRGLSVAHAHGIVHRDLKPANLFVVPRDDGGELLKILDFGIAKLEDGGAGETLSTGTGRVLGTPAYMAPEQARGERDMDRRVDVYALGAILYELLSGTKAHPGDNPNVVIFQILRHQIAPLRTLRDGLPCELLSAIERAMALDPSDRYLNVDELANALTRFAGGEPKPTRGTGAPSRNEANPPSGDSACDANRDTRVSADAGPGDPPRSRGGEPESQFSLGLPESYANAHTHSAASPSRVPWWMALVAALLAGVGLFLRYRPPRTDLAPVSASRSNLVGLAPAERNPGASLVPVASSGRAGTPPLLSATPHEERPRAESVPVGATAYGSSAGTVASPALAPSLETRKAKRPGPTPTSVGRSKQAPEFDPRNPYED